MNARCVELFNGVWKGHRTDVELEWNNVYLTQSTPSPRGDMKIDYIGLSVQQFLEIADELRDELRRRVQG